MRSDTSFASTRNRPLVVALGVLSVATATGCGPTEVVVVHPNLAEFPVTLSPGLAPGLASGCDGEGLPEGRLRGRIYDIPLSTRLLPDFATMSPVETVCLDQLYLTPRRSVHPGFPGLRGRYRWFAADLEGAFTVEEPGLYDFRLTSDDGSQLYIDDTLVVDNDGYHPPRAAVAAAQLAPGRHTMRVPYWQGPGPMALMLEVARHGGPYAIFEVDRPLGSAPPLRQGEAFGMIAAPGGPSPDWRSP